MQSTMYGGMPPLHPRRHAVHPRRHTIPCRGALRASTGTREAVQLRDGDQQRYAGERVRQVVGHVNGEIARALVVRPFASAAEVDAALSALDGTDIKSRLGVNAIIGVSLAGRGTRYRTPS
jgi:enolase